MGTLGRTTVHIRSPLHLQESNTFKDMLSNPSAILLMCLVAAASAQVHPIGRRASAKPELRRSTKSNEEILREFNLWNKTMVRDESVGKRRELIEWTQTELSSLWNLFKVRKSFYFMDYYEDGNKKNPVYKVFVAQDIDIPDSFCTCGYKNELNLAFYNMHTFKTMIFVIMPSNWDIYQHRFLTQAFNDWASKAGAALATAGGIAAGVSGAAAAGAAMGSVIPGAGTAAGAVVGATAGFLFLSVQDDLFGDYLRHIG